jgi:integrase
VKDLGKSKISSKIKYRKVRRYETVAKGPEWKDVRSLLDHGFGSSHAELRAAAVVSLCAIYALRRSEVTRLRLCDIDWVAETLTVRRSKSGVIQRFRLQFEVGATILNYLRNARPKSACKSLFLSIRPPYRPMDPSVIWKIVANKLRRLGIHSGTYGLHAFRHSCATKLLREGIPLKDVAEFLGHKSISSAFIYAKFDQEILERVADFSLSGLQ